MTAWERLIGLRPFLIAAYVIAFAQWAISPQIIPHWWPAIIGLPDAVYIWAGPVLSFLWIGVVAVGFRIFGSVAILLLGSFYGLYPLWLWGMAYWVCATGGDCL